jgi:hypothetical protein
MQNSKAVQGFGRREFSWLNPQAFGEMPFFEELRLMRYSAVAPYLVFALLAGGPPAWRSLVSFPASR